MSTGGSQYQTPYGQPQFNQAMTNVQNNNANLQGQWAGVNQQQQNALSGVNQISPQFQSQMKQGLQNNFNEQLGYLNQGYGGLGGYGQKYRENNFNNVQHFGGINNSVGRDTNNELAGQYNQALGQLMNNQFEQGNALTQQQLYNNQNYLSDINNYANYINSYNDNLANLGRVGMSSGLNENGQMFNPNYRSGLQNTMAIASMAAPALGTMFNPVGTAIGSYLGSQVKNKFGGG